jgi:hypothetical protein
MRRTGARFTALSMMGVTAIIAILTLGVLCVLRAEEFIR